MNDYYSVLGRLVCGAGEVMISAVEEINARSGDYGSFLFLFLVP